MTSQDGLRRSLFEIFRRYRLVCLVYSILKRPLLLLLRRIETKSLKYVTRVFVADSRCDDWSNRIYCYLCILIKISFWLLRTIHSSLTFAKEIWIELYLFMIRMIQIPLVTAVDYTVKLSESETWLTKHVLHTIRGPPATDPFFYRTFKLKHKRKHTYKIKLWK